MAKGGEVEARWRVHGDAWKASGGTQRAYCQEHELKITRSVTGTSAWPRSQDRGRGKAR